MRAQVASVDAVISLSLVATMLILFAQMFQDFSPIYQMLAYRETLRAAEHALNVLLFSDGAWVCENPEGIPVPACIKPTVTVSKSNLGLDEYNCFDSCSLVSGCSATPDRNVPVVVLTYRACIGSDWNTCTWTDCNLEVWRA